MKKILSTAIILVMAFAATANASFVDGYAEDQGLDELNPFSDISNSHPNKRAINNAWLYEFIEGYPDGTFGPDRPINRAEIVKIMIAEELEGEIPDANVYNNCFSDVTTEWFAPYICYALEQGYIAGYEDGTYRPANPVNRVEAIKIILEVGLDASEWPDPTDADKAIELPVDIEEGQWYEGYARMAIVKGLVDGEHVTQDSQGQLYYYPGENMTRKEVVEMVWRIVIWVVERMTYAEATAELGCLQVANPETENYTEDQINTLFYKIFEYYGFDPTEAEEATTKYYYDTVGDTHLERLAGEKCGPGVEYDNWLLENGFEELANTNFDEL